MFQRPIPHATRSVPNAQELSEARFRRFLRELQAYERKQTFERTLDGLLDLYSLWKRTHAEAVKLRLVMLLFELHRLNAEFQCELSFPDCSPCEKSSSET